MSLFLFYLLAATILISGLLVVTLRNVFHSALFLVLTFFTVAGLYLTLNAEFLAAVQVLIYVGAVTILMLFAIMLTYQIQSKSVRQVNEQVIPAAIISAIFLALAIFAMTKTFGGIGPASPNTGTWTASIDTDELSAGDNRWYWTASLEDNSGKSYIAGSVMTLIPRNAGLIPGSGPAPDLASGSGYLISSRPDFSTKDSVFAEGETVYLRIWSDRVNYGAISDATWTLVSQVDNSLKITRRLSNSNPDIIGRLLMSTYVLPFEIVSVLLLAALMGAIIIARKDV